MKRLIALVLCAVMALPIAAHASALSVKQDFEQQPINQKTPSLLMVSGMNYEEETGIVIGMPSPFGECNSLEDAEKQTGFKLALPERVPAGYSQKAIETIKNEMIQVFYENGEKEILIRKAKGSDDVSGDYNEYSENKALTVGSLQVSTRGNSGKVSVATWTDGQYTYSVSVGFENEGLDATAISDMISGIR